MSIPAIPLSAWLTARFAAPLRRLTFAGWAVETVTGVLGVMFIALAAYMVASGSRLFVPFALWPGVTGAVSMYLAFRIHRTRPHRLIAK